MIARGENADCEKDQVRVRVLVRGPGMPATRWWYFGSLHLAPSRQSPVIHLFDFDGGIVNPRPWDTVTGDTFESVLSCVCNYGIPGEVFINMVLGVNLDSPTI